jgi:hypothetical protein
MDDQANHCGEETASTAGLEEGAGQRADEGAAIVATSRPKPPAGASSAGMGAELWRATMRACWPWAGHWTYRGATTEAGRSLGYATETVKRWLYPGSRGVTHAASLRVIALLRARIAVASELLRQWETYAAERERIEAQTTPGFRFHSFRATERAVWRSRPRVKRGP